MSVLGNLDAWTAQIHNSTSLKEWDDVRVRLIGKTGEVTQLLKTLGALPPEERKARGAQINDLKEAVITLLDAQKDKLNAAELAARLAAERVDITLSARPETVGNLHPLTQAAEEIKAYFAAQGFVLAHGPDIETEENNFTALNIPDHHPARQMHDTFYLKDLLLRTHTSTVQVRTMRTQPPPMRVLSLGRVYRCDYDATHTPMFHQVEGLVIDKGIHMGHLKGCIIEFLRHFFNNDTLPVRLRPSFFPFTEPSAEVDIGCTRTGGQLVIGEGQGWLEILGCGMVHPNVLRYCGVDPEIYQGFAFGMGVDRLAMLKYGIPDLRSFFDADVRWIQHHGFSPFLS